MKLNNGDSPLFALRVRDRKLFADWRLGSAVVEHHDSVPSLTDDWNRFDLRFGPLGAMLWVNGKIVTAFGWAIGPSSGSRYLKLGPYRDRDERWGDGPAAVDFRDVSRAVLSDQEP